MAKTRKIKVYKCEMDGRYGNGVAVVATCNKADARRLAKRCVEQLRLGGYLNPNRMLVTELTDLIYAGQVTPAVILWSHYVT